MIQLFTCGYNFVHGNGIVIDRPRGSGDYAFVLFKSRAELVLHGHLHTIEKNTYILMKPHTPHLYRHLDKPFINDWFHCSGNELESFLSEIGFPLDTPIYADDTMLISKCLMDMSNYLRQNSPLKERILDCDLQSLFMKLVNLRNQSAVHESKSQYLVPFTKLRNQLYSSPHSIYTVDKLASSVNLSKSYFQHIYKELFGCSIIMDLINARLEYAKYLLLNSNTSINLIASMCGYENDTHFMRQFKKFVGVTPSQYKRNRISDHERTIGQ
ncbi:helix-turn-helix domain-containing protein [Paenibacillus oryzisoli]|uniref:AraC family transcriptional regulator n=1 Tax=Paenibacillus oryzisoli TaxID=1850517 RepID=A0A198AJJ7_9BACL|nr:AraC family transcriptional regulator [Paenibacillus oryzisoli]OAS21250.1 AraC family transcriptional regulator [Paenibacillus oryzisoli]